MKIDEEKNRQIIAKIRDLAGSVTMGHFPETPAKMADADEWDSRVQSGLAEAVVVTQGNNMIDWFGFCLIQLGLGGDGGLNPRLMGILESLWDAAEETALSRDDGAPESATAAPRTGNDYGKAGDVIEKIISLAGSMILEDPDASSDLSDAEEWGYQVQSGLAESVVEILRRDIGRVIQWFGYCMQWGGLGSVVGCSLEPKLQSILESLLEEATEQLARNRESQ